MKNINFNKEHLFNHNQMIRLHRLFMYTVKSFCSNLEKTKINDLSKIDPVQFKQLSDKMILVDESDKKIGYISKLDGNNYYYILLQ